MADAAEVLPLPEEEPANDAPKSDDSAAADDSGEDKGKDVSFGTFLTVGPKRFQNVTIVGYDSLRDSVRAVRRSGNSVENIQIPYSEYKTIIEQQKESDKATGRRPKKNLSKAVSGYFGKSVSVDGSPSQVIGYDAQSDEVLVSDGAKPRWMKSGDMLRSTQTFSSTRPLAAVPSSSTTSSRAKPRSSRVVQEQRGTAEQGTAVTSELSTKPVDVAGTTTAQVTSSNEVSSAPTSVSAGSSSTVSTPGSIRETRVALQSERAANPSAVNPQSAAAAVEAVAATIPASDAGATAVIAAAQKVLTAYGASADNRQKQIQKLSGLISDASSRIDALQQRAKQSRGSGKNAEATQIEQEISEIQSERRSLQNQQTDAQVARINEDNRAAELVDSVQRLTPDENGVVPEEQVAQVQKLMPTLVPLPTAPGASPAAALPRPKPMPAPRTYAPGIPSRRTSRAPSPSVRTPKPIRPLGGSLSAIGSQAQRAVDFGAAQARARGAEREDSTLSDSSEEALATEGGMTGYSGPLDLPERRPQSYTSDVEPEKADIYGAQEEASRAEMRRINTGLQSRQPEDQFGLPQEPGAELARESLSTPYEEPIQQGPSPDELARAAAFQQATAQSVQQQGQQQKKKDSDAESAAERAANLKKQIETTKKTISNLVDAFDAIHGLADVVGLLMTFAHLNLRLALTPLDRNLPFIPKAGFPFECTVIACFDLMVCLTALSMMLGPIIIIAAVIAAVSGATFGLSEWIGTPEFWLRMM